eukprot:14967828-Alexandrium_andersonii.AAC.1
MSASLVGSEMCIRDRERLRTAPGSLCVRAAACRFCIRKVAFDETAHRTDAGVQSQLRRLSREHRTASEVVEKDPALRLGARQVGAAVPSLFELEGCLRVLQSLLLFAYSRASSQGQLPT